MQYPRIASKRPLLVFSMVVLMIWLNASTLSIAQEEDRKTLHEPGVGERVRINQVGYLPQAEKLAVVLGDAQAFQLRNIRTNKVVWGGKLSGPFQDENSGDTVRYADFSEWQTEGTYVVEIEGGAASFPFRIGSDVYDYAMLEAARSYTRQRSITDVHDPITGVSFNAGHLQDAEARMYFSDEFHDEGGIIDVSGGWYDAGDFGMYIPPSAVTVAQLMLAYELSPEGFYRGQLMFPHGVDQAYGDMEIPDLLLEVRFNLEWMEKMQRPDGAVYHKKSGLRWPGFILPEQDVQTRYVFGLSTFGTAQYAAAMAMAARVFAPFDPEFAARALDNARRAQAYLEANPEPYFRRDEGQDSGSGAYSKETDLEERAWAAAELLKTTGEEAYDTYLQANLLDTLTATPSFVTWYDTSALAQWAYLTSDHADSAVQEQVREAFIGYADAIVQQIRQDGYHSSLTADEYTWASAKNAVAKGSILLMAHELEPNERYIRGALDQLHYILGLNATGYSYLTGIGTKTPFDIHHRIRAATGTDMPGLLVGGPNRFGGDPLLDALLQSESPPASAKAYLDEQGSWATNEYAIDYTAPAFFTLAYFSSANYTPASAVQEVIAPDVDVDTAEVGTLDDFTNLTGWSTFSDAASTIAFSQSDEAMSAGEQSLQVDYALSEHGWMGVVKTVDSDWSDINGVRFALLGEGTGNPIRIEIRDAANVHHERIITDDEEGWRVVELDFADFSVRQDYQPEGVNPGPNDAINLSHIQSFTLSPLTAGSGTLHVSELELY